MRATHRHAEDKYEVLREQSRNIAVSTLPTAIRNSQGQVINLRDTVRLTKIDFHSELKAKYWENSPLRQVDWEWREGTAEYAFRHPKRFELAIWCRNDFLCGLSLGRPTWSGNKLRLDFLEASPEKTPLSGTITDITIAAAVAYARYIGAVEIRMMNPINETVRDYYLKRLSGFSYNEKGDYCYRKLS